MTTHAETAKAIRSELKKTFPAIKFTVKSESYSMGNAVRIRWIDGVTTDAVREIVGKYQYGSFNGQEDIYEHTNCREDIPQVKYVQLTREYSDEAKAEAKMKLEEKYGMSLDDEMEVLKKLNDYPSTLIYRMLSEQEL